MKSKFTEKLFVCNGYSPDNYENKNFITSILSQYSMIETINIGSAKNGFKLEELKNKLKNNDDNTFYNIFIDMHGKTKSLQENSLNYLEHYLRLEEENEIKTREFFSELNKITNNKPVNIILMACMGKHAQNYLKQLPPGSVLATFSGYKTLTSVIDFSIPGMNIYSTNYDLKYAYEVGFANILSGFKGPSQHGLLQHIVEIYCLNQRENVFNPTIGIHTKSSRVFTYKIGDFVKKSAENFEEFSPLFKKFFAKDIINEDHVKKLISKFAIGDLTIKDVAPKFSISFFLNKINDIGINGLIEFLEHTYYRPGSFSKDKFEQLILFKSRIYDKFIIEFKDKSLKEVKELLEIRLATYIPESLLALKNFSNLDINERNQAGEDQVNKIFDSEESDKGGIKFGELIIELEQFDNSQTFKRSDNLLKIYFEFTIIEKELALLKLMQKLIAEFQSDYLKKASELEQAEKVYETTGQAENEVAVRHLTEVRSQYDKFFSLILEEVDIKLSEILGGDFNIEICKKYNNRLFSVPMPFKEILIKQDYLERVFKLKSNEIEVISDKDFKMRFEDVLQEYSILTNPTFIPNFEVYKLLDQADPQSQKMSNHNIALGLAAEHFFTEELPAIINDVSLDVTGELPIFSS